MKVTVFYGTDGGNTRTIADQVASHVGANVVEISGATAADFEGCDLLILGTPTCGYGDLQEDWHRKLSLLADVKLAGRTVALFGLGDQRTYADTFADAMGELYEVATGYGAVVIGTTSTAGYEYYGSRAVVDDVFVGLVLDQDNQPDETEGRIAAWAAALKAAPELQLVAQA